MSEQLTFEEIQKEVRGRKTTEQGEWFCYNCGMWTDDDGSERKDCCECKIFMQWVLCGESYRLNQIDLFDKLRDLADYFNGENNWVPEHMEDSYYPQVKQDRLDWVKTHHTLPLPTFKRMKDIKQANTIIERDFPELIESFTKKK